MKFVVTSCGIICFVLAIAYADVTWACIMFASLFGFCVATVLIRLLWELDDS